MNWLYGILLRCLSWLGFAHAVSRGPVALGKRYVRRFAHGSLRKWLR